MSHIQTAMVTFGLWLSHIAVAMVTHGLWLSHAPFFSCLVCDWVTYRLPRLRLICSWNIYSLPSLRLVCDWVTSRLLGHGFWLIHMKVVMLCLFCDWVISRLSRLSFVCDWVTSRFTWLRYTLFFVKSPSIGMWNNFCKEWHNHHESADERRHEFVREYVALWYERSVPVRYQLHSLLKIWRHILWISHHICRFEHTDVGYTHNAGRQSRQTTNCSVCH